ncbi:flagellar basal body-associated FliL family protein [uncultured Umboniibacter sp.]|uniref:flagellar basal body-associated FliL family protein n=1 Tax=uncultured Umboniibacter sp. TaxID=1798917 RepID=UPI0026299D99|nr:flagellar basal body-associated FliL family protein [uncultured Umboniibacter sp.]
MKKTLIVILFSSILSSAFTVTALVYFDEMRSFISANEGFETPLEIGLADELSSPAIYVALDKVILTVNGRRTDHLVLIEVAIKTRKPELFEDREQLMPVIQNRLLRLFSENLNDDIVIKEAIDKIEREVEETIDIAMLEIGEVQTIDQVMVTSFIVQ